MQSHNNSLEAQPLGTPLPFPSVYSSITSHLAVSALSLEQVKTHDVGVETFRKQNIINYLHVHYY